jgi:hypothetical protein
MNATPSAESSSTPNRGVARRNSLLWALVFFAALYATYRIGFHGALSTGTKIALCAVCAATGAYAFWRSERAALLRKDELEQRIRTDAMAVAFATSTGILIFLGVLESAGIRLYDPANYACLHLFAYVPALYWSRRRFR